MISLKEIYPEGSYIDFKDKDTNDWQVGLVLKTNENSVKVRTEGWPFKYDEVTHISLSLSSTLITESNPSGQS